MKVVILCGGKGLRYNDEMPKGLAMIGDIPILQHVMNIYALQGYNDFILILGHKAELIENHFNSIHHGYNITYEHINKNMKTGGALRTVKSHIKFPDCKFLCTYCDTLGNINIPSLRHVHDTSDNIATLTTVKTNHIYGILRLSLLGDKIKKFEEKPKMKEWINGGFFVFDNRIFNYIFTDNDVLETDVFSRLVIDKKIGAYKHYGYWGTLNTLKDQAELNDMCKEDVLEKWYDIK